MIIIVFIVIFILLYLMPVLRCSILNIHNLLYYIPFDLVNYFKYKDYNKPRDCKLICYTGTFGKGKTLSAVKRITNFYNKYNNKYVFDKERKCFVLQKVNILSNVVLSVPYVHLNSLEQIVDITTYQKDYDYNYNVLTVTTVLLDEASILLNSREFKKNINPKFLSSLLTQRHFHFADFVYTSQRFNLVDKLMRDVTSEVYNCDKLWRFQRINVFNAWEMENCSNPLLLKPIRSLCWFVRNKDYYAYDTFAIVGDLKKDWQDGNIMSDDEILSLQSDNSSTDNINYSKKFIRKKKKMCK